MAGREKKVLQWRGIHLLLFWPVLVRALAFFHLEKKMPEIGGQGENMRSKQKAKNW